MTRTVRSWSAEHITEGDRTLSCPASEDQLPGRPRSGVHSLWNGLKLRLKTTSPVRTAGARALGLQDVGLLIRIDRDYDAITLQISKDGEARKSFSGLRDMREVLDKVRKVAENYQRPRRSWWAAVPANQY